MSEDYEQLMKVLGEDKSESSLRINRVLTAKSFFERLDISPKDCPIDPSVVRKQYKKAALSVHPDKCDHLEATRAFQMITEAFEELYDPKRQKSYVESLLTRDRPLKRRKKDQWMNCSWKQFMQHLKNLEKEEAHQQKMRQDFIRSQSQVFSQKHNERILLKCRRICFEMDERNGLEANPLLNKYTSVTPQWSVEIDLKCSSADIINGIEEFLRYLRTQHVYCVFCGTFFEGYEDMSESCPGMYEEDH